jgi:bla regulator protein blaR1
MTEFIVNHLWQSSCFALLAGVLAFMLRGYSPRVRYWVWLSASLKFLIPWVLLVSLGSLVPWPVHRVASVATPTLPGTLVQLAVPFSPNPYPAVQARAQIRWGVTSLALFWAAGFIAIAFTRCRNWYRIRAMLRAGTPVKLPIAVPALVVSNFHGSNFHGSNFHGSNSHGSSAIEPGVVGFLKPVLVLPALLLERLNPKQLEALLAHELSHVRRRDNLFAALHMGVETIFWFHPLVWWIGSRMLEERELACDEEVLRLGCERTDYVRGILTVCEHYSEAPLACVSGVTSADVKKRLKIILQGTLPRELTRHKKLALSCAAIAAIAVPLGLGVLFAQQPSAKFEVASVRRAVRSGGPGDVPQNMESSPGHFAMRNKPLRYCLEWAYDLKDYEIAGPDWIKDEERYDIVANAAGPATNDQMRPMLQALLIERFQMKLHRETREMQVYALVLGKGAPKVKPPAPGEVEGLSGGANGVRFQKEPISRLTFLLTRRMDRPVLDKTGLNGLYDFTIDISGLNNVNPQTADDATGPSIFTAVQADLGLKLESRKEPIKILVIDSANKVPTEN